jgi:hypothetical protein
MTLITKQKITELITSYIHDGLNNKEISNKLNAYFGADSSNSLTVKQVAELKEALGLKGLKAKRKLPFTIVDELKIEEAENSITNVEFEEMEEVSLDNFNRSIRGIEADLDIEAPDYEELARVPDGNEDVEAIDGESELVPVEIHEESSITDDSILF